MPQRLIGVLAVAGAALLAGAPGAADAATPDPIPRPGSEFVVDPLGPSTDEKDDSGNGVAVGLGVAAVALIGGGLVLRHRGRRED